MIGVYKMSTWDERLELERAGQKPADEIYTTLFNATRVERFSHERNLLIDQQLGVDCIIHMANGQAMTLQEKFRAPRWNKYPPQLTIEYMGNPQTGERGDWFNCAAQLYSVGYFRDDMNGFASFLIVNLAQLWYADNMLNLDWELKQNRYANASFKALNWADIPKSAIVYYQR